ncbi:DUF4924 family protein [Bacteroides sp. 214]|uniref:DUF4924 family protein n=1 Tax=Bacteroides sp. 214 TaxID=2302935 RepID=UPI0013D166A9|nr:DUF4924 family protein [Bacteroides sp. 214]NDW11637.1 DUF4924 family protein [Bacteroides sp. 214]
MFIAQQLREKNIAEYLIYMWQVEDLIRAAGFDVEKICQTVVAGATLDEEQQKALEGWYADLIQMMRDEGVTQNGHLQINKNVIINLTELHTKLLATSAFPYYSAAYYKALPVIVELRSRSGSAETPELETCFDALYGVMLLRLQKKTVSAETTKAINIISSFLSMLANYYDRERKGELDFGRSND